MKEVPQHLQQAMDDLKTIEYRLSRMEMDKVTRTAAGCFAGMIDTFRRAMLNGHGIEIPVLPDSHFEVKPEVQVEIVETTPMVPVSDGSGEIQAVTKSEFTVTPIQQQESNAEPVTKK